jgi:hypothetical protein
MILGLVRRLFGLACFALVAYAAIKVPVGRRTTWGHLVAIFTTEPAREAAEDLEDVAKSPWKTAVGGPSQDSAPRGKTPAPGTTHVRSTHQGVPASP